MNVKHQPKQTNKYSGTKFDSLVRYDCFIGTPNSFELHYGLQWKPCIYTRPDNIFFLRTQFLHSGVPIEQFDTHENCPGGCKVGQIRSRGINSIIYFPVFTAPKQISLFFYETGPLTDIITVDNISQGISCGSRVIFG